MKPHTTLLPCFLGLLLAMFNTSCEPQIQPEPKQYRLTVLSSDTLQGKVSGTGSYPNGKAATITAEPHAGYEFTAWNDGNTDNPRTITITSDTTLIAMFGIQGAEGNGLLAGLFTVNQGKQIHFSQGNLQYLPSAQLWRFALQQYEVIGMGNNGISSSCTTWIDLFCWGTSGYAEALPHLPMPETSICGNGEQDITATNYDWGVYNPVINGSNQAGIWRTLTQGEWEYLFNGRPNAANLFGLGQVAGTNGLILLPDDSLTVDGQAFVSATQAGLVNKGTLYEQPDATHWNDNTYTASDWQQMQSAGAVFLPAAGNRYGTGVYNLNNDGYYWSATHHESHYACNLYFGRDRVDFTLFYFRNYGLSVRLVQDAN